MAKQVSITEHVNNRAYLSVDEQSELSHEEHLKCFLLCIQLKQDFIKPISMFKRLIFLTEIVSTALASKKHGNIKHIR